jgi:hypothetical protein
MASSKDCQHFIREKEIQKVRSETIFHTLRQADSPAQKSYGSVAKRVFNSVETQTMFAWIENTEKPTRTTEKIITPSHKTSNSSQTATTSTKTSSEDSTKQTNITNKTSKGQLSKGPPQGYGKLIKEPVQVHN